MKLTVKPPPLPEPKVEIINLIDVLITLIAFFMFTTVFAAKQGQMKIQLPAASSSVSNKAADGFEVGLTKDNQIILSGKRMQPEELLEYLKNKCRGDELIMVKADQDCKYEWVIKLLDLIRSSGLTQVGLQVRPR